MIYTTIAVKPKQFLGNYNHNKQAMKIKMTIHKIMMACMFIILLLLFPSCGGKIPSEFAGEWEGLINPHQRIIVKIEKNGKYFLKIYQSQERYDALYEGECSIINDNLIKLPSDSYTKKFNSNSKDSDPAWSFVHAYTNFYLRRDGALSNSEEGLSTTNWYLHKTSKK